MGKKGGAKRLTNSTIGPQNPISLREEATGKLHKKTGSNVKSMLKLEHLKNLAVLAGSEVLIPSLGAFYGQCLASAAEAMGIPPDPSLITCERGLSTKRKPMKQMCLLHKLQPQKFPLITSLGTALEGSKRKRYMLRSNKETEPRSMSAKKDAEKQLAHQAKEEKNLRLV